MTARDLIINQTISRLWHVFLASLCIAVMAGIAWGAIEMDHEFKRQDLERQEQVKW